MSSVRDYRGKYATTASNKDLCRCGHEAADHRVTSPHACTGSNGECRCEQFRRARIGKVAGAKNLVAAGRSAIKARGGA